MALAGEDVGPWHSVLAGEVFSDFLGLVKPSFSAPAPVQGDGGDQSLGEVGLEAWIFQGEVEGKVEASAVRAGELSIHITIEAFSAT